MPATVPDRSRLEAVELECVRGDRRLFGGLQFSLQSGSILQVNGRNGSGKTSLLRLLCGLGLPESGEIRWNDTSIARDREDYYGELAWLGHQPGVKDELTALENIEFASATAAITPALPVKALLDEIGLGPIRHLPCRVLSAGQRQRVALCRVFVHPGTLWILDEPATALDQDGISLLQDQLNRHAGRGGIVIFTSHQPLDLDPARRQTLTLDDFS